MLTISAEVRDLLALHLIDGLGPQRISALLERFGSVDRLRRACAAELLQVPGIGEQLSSTIRAGLPGVDVAAEIERLQRAGVQVLQRDQPEYPAALKDLPGAPLLLFTRGEVVERDARAVALVGT